ncbi:integrase catalytic subunit [Caballeronia calidae]|uniref:Integrase catalytic subunit n=1 Tax=Caballeronia calidae TaxID=1777139 RepID=A0A158EDN7_9BURK|nr:DDE-type integrase/transposase/recombinase [Caballeronia calidae]SAL05001.1 integrase catalytic subunit [Caballeronia calidae]
MLMQSTCPSGIAVGDVLKDRNGDRIYIVLKTGRNSRWTHLIDIEHKAESASYRRASPFKTKTDDLLLRLSTNVEPELALEKLAKLPGNVSARRRVPAFGLSRRSEKYREIAHNPEKSKGWKLICGLLTFDLPDNIDGQRPEPSTYGDQFEELLHPETRRKRILRYCAVSDVSESMVYRTFRRFCQQGMTPAAASDDYDRCGGRGQQRNWKLAPGGMPKRRKLKASARNEEVRRLLELAADYYFSFEYSKGKRAQKTLAQAIRWIEDKFLRDRVVYNEQGEMVELNLDRRIVLTVRQLQYHIYRNYSYEERRIRKVGLRKYLLHERPLKGRLRTSRGPGERFHIDATVVDIYLVGQVLRTKVIGRPVLYLVVDDYTAMVVGFYLTFEPPSWNGAMMALANAVSPKVPFCESLGILIEEKQWPADRLCETLYADQGEVSSVHKGHSLIIHFRIEMQNPPSYRPDMRAIMERRFGIIPAIWNSLVPGVVEKESFARGVEHPAYHAALDIVDFRRVVCYAVLSYNKHIIRGYPTPPEMVDRGLAPTPLNLWRYGTEINGCGRHVDVDEFRAIAMPKTTATIDGKGIAHNGMHYACPTLSLIERQAMFRGQKTETSVEIGYDSADNSCIQLHGLGEPISCPLSEHELDKVCGLTYREQELYTDLDATNRGMSEEACEPERAMTDHNIAKIAKEAVSKTSSALKDAGMKRPDIDDMDESREIERSAESTSCAEGRSQRARSPRQNKRAGTSFIKLIKNAQQEAILDRPVTQETYNDEGDAFEQSVGDGNPSADESDRMTAKDLREKRARELLAAMDA